VGRGGEVIRGKTLKRTKTKGNSITVRGDVGAMVRKAHLNRGPACLIFLMGGDMGDEGYETRRRV